MASIVFTVEMEENLKHSFEVVCDSLGIGVSEAVSLFATAVVNEGRIPFEIDDQPPSRGEALGFFELGRSQAQANNPDGMTLDEINAVIAAARAQMDLC